MTSGLGPTQRAFDTQKPRILQIGSGQHKNLDTLIKAVERLECELHIVGKLSEANRQALEAKGIAHVNEFAVSDARMEAIYHSCDILFFASRHEGFGLPILEGNAAGIPVITSNCYSMPHVAGEGAVIVDPESEKEIRDAIDRLSSDKEFRDQLVSRGFKNLERFSAKSCSAKYIRIYEQLCGE